MDKQKRKLSTSTLNGFDPKSSKKRTSSLCTPDKILLDIEFVSPSDILKAKIRLGLAQKYPYTVLRESSDSLVSDATSRKRLILKHEIQN